MKIIPFNAKFVNALVITLAGLSLLQIHLILSIIFSLYNCLSAIILIISYFSLVVFN